MTFPPGRSSNSRTGLVTLFIIMILCVAQFHLGREMASYTQSEGPNSLSAKSNSFPQTLMSIDSYAPNVQPPAVSFTQRPDSPAAGYSVEFNATPSGGIGPYTFDWTFGDGVNGTGNPVSHIYASGGSYNVTIMVKDTAGATFRTYRLIPVKYDVPPIAAFNWIPATVFSGETVFFDGSGSYDPDGVIITRVWQLGDGGSEMGIGVLHTYPSPGIYDVTLSVTDDSGVTAVKSLAVWVHPALSFTVSTNTTEGAAPLGVSFGTQVSGGQGPYTFFWDFGDGLTSARPSPIHNYTISRVYRAQVTVTDSLGHSVSQDITITVYAASVELSFLGFSEATLKIGGILTTMSALPLAVFLIIRRRKSGRPANS